MRSRDKKLRIEADEVQAEILIEMLATLRAFSANIRSLTTFGQSMNDLLKAGCNGNDEGFIRAAAIDPTVEGHPAITQRVSRALIAKRDPFIDDLQKAARSGPSKKIDKELNQLRCMLGLFREVGALARMADEERYQLFCEQLGLYPTSGENPKAALCIFIKRWEAGLAL